MGLMRWPRLAGSPISAWVCRYGLGFVNLGLGVGLCRSRRGGGVVCVIEGKYYTTSRPSLQNWVWCPPGFALSHPFFFLYISIAYTLQFKFFWFKYGQNVLVEDEILASKFSGKLHLFNIFNKKKSAEMSCSTSVTVFANSLFVIFFFFIFYDHCNHLRCNSLVLISFFIDKDQDEMQLPNCQHIDRSELLTYWQIYESYCKCKEKKKCYEEREKKLK